MDGTGLAVGLAAGIAIGLAAGKKQKPWSELSESEKKLKFSLMIFLGLMVLAGFVAWFYYSG
jgi:F0F1-type ATP synthase membrane subunit c/vacuolar-type H+-ATPase subunit K